MAGRRGVAVAVVWRDAARAGRDGGLQTSKLSNPCGRRARSSWSCYGPNYYPLPIRTNSGCDNPQVQPKPTRVQTRW